MCVLSESGEMKCPRPETWMVHAFQAHEPRQIDIVAHMRKLSVMIYAEQPARIPTHFNAAGSDTRSRWWFVPAVTVASSALSIGNAAWSDSTQESIPSSVTTTIILVLPHRARCHARPNTIRLILSRASALVHYQITMTGSTAALTMVERSPLATRAWNSRLSITRAGAYGP